MPNWITNRLTVSGPNSEQVIRDNLDLSKPVSFDFNLAVPMPVDLDGDDTWYDWRIYNWGCKWNASDTIMLDEVVIIFSTPWAMPDKYMDKLSEKYPENRFEISWYDEDMGYNMGTHIYENGEIETIYLPDTNKEKMEFYESMDVLDNWFEVRSYTEEEKIINEPSED